MEYRVDLQENNTNKPMAADGYHDAIIGLDTSFEVHRLVYDVNKIIEILINQQGMSDIDAIEFANYNIIGAYVGEGTPLFIYGGNWEYVSKLI